MLQIKRISEVIEEVLAGKVVRVPTTIGLTKYYRKQIEEYVIANTTEPILIAISSDQSFIQVQKYPHPIKPISEL